MKTFIFLILLSSLLFSRENPFDSNAFSAGNEMDEIPILTITTNPVYASKPKKKKSPPIAKKQEHILNPIVEKQPIMIHASKPEVKVIEKTIITPIAQPTIKTISVPPIIEIQPAKVAPKKVVHKKKLIKSHSYKTLYRNYFLKVQTNQKAFKLFTKDRLLQKKFYTSPNRVALDFKRLQYFHSKSLTLKQAKIKKLRIGSHHTFYRITFEMNRKHKIKLIKKPYGYLVTLH